jgi:PiT family inorganic phosphate transporter
MHPFDTPITTSGIVVLVIAIACCLAFEFVNGFHDTANAVATVIYTRSLRPWIAVIWSGFCNFLGVYLGGIAVAMSILKLLPVELLTGGNASAGLAMVLAILVSAILWNLGTWYLGLPASSSHTLIGAILGVALANSMLPGHVFGSGVNWHKVGDVGSSLLLSPIVGLTLAGGLVWLARKLIPFDRLHLPPKDGESPPGWIRGLLITTCSGVSFAHGSNDGQKGVGLIMLILIGILPADFALSNHFDQGHIAQAVAVTHHLDETVVAALDADPALTASNADVAVPDSPAAKLSIDLADIRAELDGKGSLSEVRAEERWDLRTKIVRVDESLAKLEKNDKLSATAKEALKKDRAVLRSAVDYAPTWVLLLVSASLGIGTMVGWKRIVVTIGEKIGKTHLTYAQGASAELVAMTTIGASAAMGLPVSTTHVLSSGIAGTMIAQKSGIQGGTVRSIALAWVLTLPASMVVAGVLFLGFRAITPAFAATSAQPRVAAVLAAANPAAAPELHIRIHGSTTMGADLVPTLAQAYFAKKGATHIERTAGAGDGTWTVSAMLPGGTERETIELASGGSATAFADLADHACDIGMSSRPVTADELKHLAAAGLGDMESAASEHVIALDGVAVVVNPANPAHDLSLRALADLLSGATAAWPSGEAVRVYGRDDTSGTYATLRDLVLGNRPLAASAVRLPDGARVSDAVASDPAGIGFTNMPETRTAKVVAIAAGDGAATFPSRFTVATEEYPLTRRLYLYTPARGLNAAAADFVAFATSADGQAAVETLGFVDLAVKAVRPASCPHCPRGYGRLAAGGERLSVDFRFRKGEEELDSRGERDVARVVDYLADNGRAAVTLVGFSDSAGSREENERLSRARADAVARELSAYGVHPAHVLALGGMMPVASNDDEAGRTRNRRVEVWVESTRHAE